MTFAALMPWLGAAFAIAIALAIVLVAVAFLADRVDGLIWRRRARADELAVRRFGDRVRDFSWWFSEDAATSDLLRGIADGAGYTAFDHHRLRDAWRNKRSTKETAT